MVGTVELVALAIQAGVRLTRAGRKIYAENAISREITLPLPMGFQSPIATARTWAERLRQQQPEAYEERYRAAVDADRRARDPEAQRLASMELVQIYLLDVSRGLVPTGADVPADVAGLAAVKQWADGQSPFPHPLQRVAGALVEIAIDYFLDVPGALDENSKRGRAVRALLEGLDDFSFQEASWDSLVIALFSTGLDTLCEQPGLITGDADRQRMIGSLMKGVAGDLQTRLQKLPAEGDLDAERRIREVSTTLLRSLLRNGGELVAENPALLGIEGQEQQAFFGQTFSTLMDVLAGEGDGLDLGAALRRLASTQGMDRLVSAALLAGSEHPEVFGVGNEAVRGWLQKVLKGLYADHQDGTTFFDVDLFPEIASLALVHGVSDLPHLVEIDPDAQATTVLVARQLYGLLAQPAANGKPPQWRLALARSDVASVFEDVLHGIASSPAWAIEIPQDAQRLATLARVGVEALIDLGEGGFKELLRGDALEPLLVAALETGLVEQLERVDRGRVQRLVAEVRKTVQAHGSTGLRPALESGAVRDLLAGVASSDILETLVGDDANRAKAGVEVAVSLLDQLRTGELLTVPQMADRLREVA